MSEDTHGGEIIPSGIDYLRPQRGHMFIASGFNPRKIIDVVILAFGRIMLAIEQSFSPKTGMWKMNSP
ncbi:hypothetical protein [Mongoliibacter ruber]|uniref:Uncharacterized protein n=1 Tax=Mongoliibacter ruber TaxID=1750599 RepID=A0A2T0WWB9_9BACT|nr:hypothetical protein [Mongoliibacter ruber]PRY90979.1 hypothetical protein CLW00_101655 [Mongoliibacter ruber]